MKKRSLSMFLGVAILIASSISCLAAPTDEVKNNTEEYFTVVSIPYDFEWDYDWRTTVKARYKETKEPITLSLVYDGKIFATIPKEKANIEIEPFAAEEVKFTDYDGKYYEFSPIRELSKTGVVKGNDKGEALPFDNITRAEATAMLMRFLGLENVPETNEIVHFEDVSKNDWYYSVVMSAYYYGLVKGESAHTFSPNRNVSREEIVVMAARAVELAKLGCPNDTNMNSIDSDKISDWAKDAYSMIGNYVETDVDESNSENPVRIINPQKNATRFEVASLLRNIAEKCQVYPSQLAEQFGFDKVMPIIDGSTSTYPFTNAVYNMLFSNGDNHPQKPVKHSKSHATYQRLINGEINMSFASVYPASDILKMAEEKGVEIELIPIAYDAMIFFTNKDNTIEGLTSEQISNIYVNNSYENWNQLGGPDALLYPYCRNNDSGSHAQMEKHFLNGNEIHSKIMSETRSEAMQSILTDVIDAKTEEPLGYGLGYSIYYYYHNADMILGTKSHLKLLAIDGVHPNDFTIADGTYPLSNNTYIAIRKDTPADNPARKMAEFMLTEEGQLCVENAGFGGLKNGEISNAENLSYEQIEDLQKQVDEGHYPWRIDYEEVIKEFFAAKGLEVDNGTITILEGGYKNILVTFSVENKEYLVDLFKPFSRADNGIWVVRSFEEK